MAGGKETPRQKMVGLMYLVLMALLAMNVSKEVLNSFIIINEGLQKTNTNFSNKNGNTYAAFDKAFMNDKEKVGPYRDAALRVKAMSEELVTYIDSMKVRIIMATDKKDQATANILRDSLMQIDNKDNYDVPTNVMIGGEPDKPKTGPYSAMELKDKIDAYKSGLLGELPKEIGEALDLGMETDVEKKVNGVTESWATMNFYHLPLVAVLTNLSKMQSDVLNAEADVIKALYRNIDAGDFKFDALEAISIPESRYVFLGDTFRAKVMVAAYSSTQLPELEVYTELDTAGNGIGGFDSAFVSNIPGKGVYAKPTTSEGSFEWGGVIKIKGPDGKYVPFKYRDSYTVAKPALVVSPTAMNVFYRGLDNPVEVSVPGVATDLLQVSISNASKSGGNGKFKVRPGNGKNCVVSVTAEVNGENKSFGRMEFRVKDVPDPKPYIGGVTGSSTIPRSKLIAVQGISAKMENFEFDLKFDIIEFSMSMNYKGNLVEKKTRGNRLNGEMKTMLQATKKGTKVFIEGIKAKGPDGRVRDLGAISLKVL